VEVEQDQIGCDTREERFDFARVGRARDVPVAGSLEDRFEQGDVRFLVVDDQDPGFFERVVQRDAPVSVA
jgi:hypothetical protein